MSFAEKLFLRNFIISQPGGNFFTHNDMEFIVSKFKSVSFRKKEEFNAPHTLSQTIGIIYSGMFKAVSKDTNGKIKIRALFFDTYTSVVVDCCSFGNNNVSKQSIFSIGESTLLTISESDFNDLSRVVPIFGIIGRNLLTHSCKTHEQLLIKYESVLLIDTKAQFNIDFPVATNKLTREEKAFLTGAGKNIF